MRMVAMFAFFVSSVVHAATPSTGIDNAIESFLLPSTDAIAKAVFSAATTGGAEVPLILGWLIAIALLSRALSFVLSTFVSLISGASYSAFAWFAAITATEKPLVKPATSRHLLRRFRGLWGLEVSQALPLRSIWVAPVRRSR